MRNKNGNLDTLYNGVYTRINPHHIEIREVFSMSPPHHYIFLWDKVRHP